MGNLPNLESALRHAVLEKMGNYTYLISPLESIPCEVNPELIREIVEEMTRFGAVDGVETIVCLEAMGIHLGAVLSQRTGKPLSIARKKKHNIEPKMQLSCRTNYDQRTYHLYGSFVGRRVLLIDDLIASGNTLKQAVIALQKEGAIVERVFVVVAREGQYEAIFRELGTEFKALSKIRVVEDKVEIVYI
jgi:adenine phosphoribosyltransferase